MAQLGNEIIAGNVLRSIISGLAYKMLGKV